MKVRYHAPDLFSVGGIKTVMNESVKGLNKLSDDVEVLTDSEKSADILHNQSYDPFSFLKTFLSSKKTVVTVHALPETSKGTKVFDKYLQPLVRLYLRNFYGAHDYVIALSPYMENRLIELGLSSEKISVIPNGYDSDNLSTSPEKDRDFRDEYEIEEDDFVVLSVGNIQPRKGVETFYNLAERNPEIEFVWTGELAYGILTAGLPKMLYLMHTAPENLTFTGFVKDLEEPLSAADAFLLPSHQENFPMAVLEASSCSLPLILRDLPEYENLISQYCKTANDIEGFEEALKKLKKNQSEREEYSRHSKELINRYGIDNLVSNLSEFYNRVEES